MHVMATFISHIPGKKSVSALVNDPCTVEDMGGAALFLHFSVELASPTLIIIVSKVRLSFKQPCLATSLANCMFGLLM